MDTKLQIITANQLAINSINCFISNLIYRSVFVRPSQILVTSKVDSNTEKNTNQMWGSFAASPNSLSKHLLDSTSGKNRDTVKAAYVLNGKVSLTEIKGTLSWNVDIPFQV